MKEIIIGDQTWASENLCVNSFQNGQIIKESKTDNEWEIVSFDQEIPTWCYFKNKIMNGSIFGALYNWYAANDSQNIAPKGYKIPSIADYEKLVNHIGGPKIAGQKLKGRFKWGELKQNKLEFNVQPGSYRESGGYFWGTTGICASLWTSTEFNQNYAYTINIVFDSDEIHFEKVDKRSGRSIRCIKY